ncbi:MAG: acetyltransferase [Bryobacteraceae bacterium]|nr:acetyltransferase [Bryobacteraceae bacterium]
MQRSVWGFADVEIVPSRLFLLAVKIGGQAIGAFDGSRMVGFCLSIPGLKRDGTMYLHSHMLGVLEAYRNHGVGRRLKLEQRKDALSRGIGLIEWTFDPLELKNAFLNIERLGVIVRRYVPNQYGVTTSKLHGGMPTDRCVAEWILDSPRTLAILDGAPRQRELPAARIEVPTAIQAMRREDVAGALKIQTALSQQFPDCFARGLAVTGFERSEEKGTYLLSPWE